jgi:hypothetical protein
MISFFELHGLEHFSRNSRLWERGGQQNEGREGMGAGCRQPQKLNEPRKCRREVPTDQPRHREVCGRSSTARSLGSERCGQSRQCVGSLTAQVRPKPDRSADRSRILTHIVDPGRIDDHVLSWEPIVVISQIVIDPIAVVVDVGLCELHAGKRYARGRVGQLLT